MGTESFRQKYRNLVVGVDAAVPLRDGRFVTGINFDNAATTPPFVSVINEINNFAPWYSSVHRGTGYKSEICSEFFEDSRLKVLDFVNADPKKFLVVFVKNTTEAINKLSYRLCSDEKRCIILSTDMEHHSNDLPWRGKYKVDYIRVDGDGRLMLDDLEYKLKRYSGRVKLVTVTGVSNVTGFINPIYEIAELAHRYGSEICVDGAQLIGHVPINMCPDKQEQCIDYLAFSAHKMYAPFGEGVLICPGDSLKKGAPDYMGGGTVKVVTHDYVTWDAPPHSEEAGTPNLMGIMALVASIRTLKALGMKNIEAYERELTDYTLEKLKSVGDVRIYGSTEKSTERVGIIPFNIEGIYHGVTALVLSHEAGIAVRNGCFCAQPYIQKLLNVSKEEIERYTKDSSIPRPGMVRISFGLYNTFREIDVLVRMLEIISKNKERYNEKYSYYRSVMNG